MKMSDMRAKARAIFGPAIAEPMPKQPNGAKALQERANARPIPTYKVGGAVKKNMPPQPTAAEREADRKRREEYAKMKPTKEQGEAIARGNRAAAIEGGRYKNGGKAMPKNTPKTPKTPPTSDELERRYDKLRQKDLNAASMSGRPTGYSSSMKNGGKAKKDGLAVMIDIGSPKKPVKKAVGGLASMIPAKDPGTAAPTPSGRVAPSNIDPSSLVTIPSRNNPPSLATVPSRPATAAAPVSARSAALARARARQEADKMAMMTARKEATARRNPTGMLKPQISGGPAPIAKGGEVKKPVKRAVGGAGKTRKGMCK